MRPTVSEIRSTAARVLRDELTLAAGADGALGDVDKDGLTPFSQRAADGEDSVEGAMDAAMGAATAAWAAFNQASGPGKAWLSKAELAALTAADPSLGALTKGAQQIAATVKGTRPPLSVTLDAPPGISMGTRGARVLEVSLSAGPSVPVGTTFAIVVDGHRLPITKTAGGLDVWALKAPAGYGLEVLERGAVSDPNATARLKITRDAETALPDALLVPRARAHLVKLLKNERIHAADWAQYFPTQWSDNVARGVLDKLDAMFASPETEVVRTKDTVTFIGRGPYDLYTEVTLKKRDGALVHALIEID